MNRNWEDAVNYGFIGAGSGSWYTNTLHMLSPGARVWANIPGAGYVGVGLVVEPAVPVSQFTVGDKDGHQIPISKAALKGPGLSRNADNPELSEYLVRVKWIATLPVDKAIKEKGFFGNQNSVARPVSPKWDYTVRRLKERLSIS
jgi:hypothetical protein